MANLYDFLSTPELLMEVCGVIYVFDLDVLVTQYLSLDWVLYVLRVVAAGDSGTG